MILAMFFICQFLSFTLNYARKTKSLPIHLFGMGTAVAAMQQSMGLVFAMPALYHTNPSARNCWRHTKNPSRFRRQTFLLPGSRRSRKTILRVSTAMEPLIFE